jgi:hypothetical protein
MDADGAAVSERPASTPAGRRQIVLSTSLVFGVFVLVYVSTVQTHQLFAPDTRYYSAMALHFGGTDMATAAAKVARYTAGLGYATPPAHVLFGWGLVEPRVVLPVLSVPFVKIFGIPGMAVVPCIAMGLFSLLLTAMLTKRYGGGPAVATMILLLASPLLVFYGVAMLTESLSALWVALTVLAVWYYWRSPGARWIVAMVALTVILGFTRQSTLIPAGAFVSAWFFAAILRRRPNSWRVPALAVGVTSIAVQILQMVLWPGFSQLQQFEEKTGTHSKLHALEAAPRLAWKIFYADFVFMRANDHAMLILLALAVLSMVVFWRHSESHLLLGALAGTEIYNVTNGTPTVFRYGMPALTFVGLSVALLIARCTQAVIQRRPVAQTDAEADEIPTVSVPES